MVRRPPGHVAHPGKRLIALAALLLLPGLRLVDAQQQHHRQVSRHLEDVHRQPIAAAIIDGKNADDAIPGGAAYRGRKSDSVDRKSPAEADPAIPNLTLEVPKVQRKKTISALSSDKPHKKRESIIQPEDASALATLAPDAKSVRAPLPRHRASTTAGTGLASPQTARSLGDWEVEDFVLLATVDGDLWASDRKNGRLRWHLEVEQPVVETVHYRNNVSLLDEDYSPIDHYIWAVEPNRDGGIYVWIPGNNGPGLVRLPLTMRKLVGDLTPYQDRETPVVYTGRKESTLVSLDAATGRVLEWYGVGAFHNNQQPDSCVPPNDFADSAECSRSGTITLGRTDYIVDIRRKNGPPIATLKYSEWGPNNYDSDLHSQYDKTMDNRYITGQPDGKVYSFDLDRASSRSVDENPPLWVQPFSSPVARVFDIARPNDAPSGSNPELLVLAQPAPPPENDNTARLREASTFLNQTEGGSWYALSGKSYPLILEAPTAQCSRASWWDDHQDMDMTESQLRTALTGTHHMAQGSGLQRKKSLPPTLPGAPAHHAIEEMGADEDEEDGDAIPTIIPDPTEPSNVIDKVKELPQAAANNVVDFMRNPFFVLVIIFVLFNYQHNLRRWYNERKRMLWPELDDSKSEKASDDTDNLGDKENATSGVEQTTTTETEVVNPPLVPPAEVLEPKVPVEEQTGVANGPDADDDQTKTQELGSDHENKVKFVDPPERTTVPTGALNPSDPDSNGGTAPERAKKAHRGRRAGQKHRRGKKKQEGSDSRNDEPDPVTVEEAVNNAKKLGEVTHRLEPDIVTVTNDVQEVSGPILRMGTLEVNEDQQLGTGSNGTVVFAGKFDGRDVAVKRMLIQFYDIASQETRLLRESDDHPNVIRYYAQQQRDAFLYIALQLCQASLAEVVEKPHAFRDLAQAGEQDLPGVLYQITNGLSHLHKLRIVHRDLKPQNILVNLKDGKPHLLVSDFGLCKKLEGGQSSFGATTAHAAGTSGWRAPELLVDDDGRDPGTTLVDASSAHSGSGSLVSSDLMHNRRATRAIDIFSLGLVFFYVLTKGSHPFDCGDRYMREVNIRKGNYNLDALDALGDFSFEAKDLIRSMLDKQPKARPTCQDVMAHPFFWSAEKRLQFLCDVSDGFEKEPRDPPSAPLSCLESYAARVCRTDFLRQLPKDFVESLGKQRKYTGGRMLDLLRALRNKRNHYEDLSEGLKKTVGSLPEGYLGFWTRRFPNLLIACWNVVYDCEWEGSDRFRKYYVPAGL